jgi:predicted nucleotidyltransferase
MKWWSYNGVDCFLPRKKDTHMKTAEHLSKVERAALEELRTRITREFPDWTFHMTLFGSRARADAEPDSDMDVLLEVDQEHISFPEKQRLRRAASEASLQSGIVLSLLIVDEHMRKERGDFSVFQNIREEGISV